MKKADVPPNEVARAIVGLAMILIVTTISGFLAWLLGPFGPSITSRAMKIAVTAVDFAAIAGLLVFFIWPMIYQKFMSVGFWVDDLGDRLAEKLEKTSGTSERATPGS